MINVTSNLQARRADTPFVDMQKTAIAAQAAASVKAVADEPKISTLASRLSAAATVTSERNQGLTYTQLNAKVIENTRTIHYTLDAEHKAAAATQRPVPDDAGASASADAATAFVNGKGSNPFAGLSREQLSTIANDESGTFTVNERRAADTQAYNEEQAWRSQVVAKAMQEYNQTGKMTNFFKDVLAHFESLPALEQAQYPEDYAASLKEKIELDFNYFNHAAHGGPPTPGSLADLTKRTLSGPNLFDQLIALSTRDSEQE